MFEEYSIAKIISAILTFLCVVLVIRFFLYLANRNKTQIQKPDWVESDKFDTKKKSK